MSEEYNIEYLEKTFLEHAKAHETWVNTIKKNDEFGLSNSFNISKALYFICKEIIQIKDELS